MNIGRSLSWAFVNWTNSVDRVREDLHQGNSRSPLSLLFVRPVSGWTASDHEYIATDPIKLVSAGRFGCQEKRCESGQPLGGITPPSSDEGVTDSRPAPPAQSMHS